MKNASATAPAPSAQATCGPYEAGSRLCRGGDHRGRSRPARGGSTFPGHRAANTAPSARRLRMLDHRRRGGLLEAGTVRHRDGDLAATARLEDHEGHGPNLSDPRTVSYGKVNGAVPIRT